jgi:hypothetical protein
MTVPWAQAHTTLGQAEGLAALFSRRCAHEGGVGGDLIRPGQTAREQDQQRSRQAGLPEEQGQNRAGGDGQRAQRQSRNGHDQDEPAPGQVAGDHHGATRVPVGQPGMDSYPSAA